MLASVTSSITDLQRSSAIATEQAIPSLDAQPEAPAGQNAALEKRSSGPTRNLIHNQSDRTR